MDRHPMLTVALSVGLLLIALSGCNAESNAVPVADAAAVSTDEDTALAITLTATDADGDSLTYGAATQPGNGAVTCSMAGACTYTPTADYNGADSFTFTANDGSDTSAAATVTITVNPVNDAPTISGSPATSAMEDILYSDSQVTAADVDGDTLTFSLLGAIPNWLSIDSSTGVLSGTPANSDVGTTGSLSVSVSDGQTSTSLTYFTVEVVNVNDPPTINGTPSGTGFEDSLYSNTNIFAQDVDTGDMLTFSMTGNPAWLGINASTGALSGTPTNADVGITSPITVTVTDLASAMASLPQFQITVYNTPDTPTITGSPSELATEDSPYSDTSIVGADVDAGDYVTFSMTGNPAWLSIDAATGELSGTPTNSDVGTSGSITVTATDSTNRAASLASFTITVANVNDAPTVSAAVPDLGVVPASFPMDIDLSAYLTDVDVGDTLTYSVTVNSSPATVGTSVSGSMLTLSHLVSQASTVTLTVQLTDGIASPVSDTFDVVITPARYQNGANWNDYVDNDGADRFSASDSVCPFPSGRYYDDCIHGGEVRAFNTGEASCSGLSAADTLGAFDWVCVDNTTTNTAFFYSTGLVDGMYLSDLIDWTATPAWKTNQLVVTGGSGYTSPSGAWWGNPVVENTTGGDLMTAGEIHAVTADPGASIGVFSDGIAVVVKPGVILSAPVILQSSAKFTWFEGDINNPSGEAFLLGAGHSVVRGATAIGTSGGLRVSGNGSEGLVQDVVAIATGSFPTSLSMQGISYMTFRNIRASNSTFYGVSLYSTHHNRFDGLIVDNNATEGIHLDTSADNNQFAHVLIANNQYGITLRSAKGNSFVDATVANSTYNGISTSQAPNNRFIGVTSANNGQFGVGLEVFSHGSVVLGLTAANNLSEGLYVGSSSSNTLAALSLAHNGSFSGFALSSSSNNQVIGLVSAHQGYGVYLESNAANNAFSSPFKVGDNFGGDCYVDAETTSTGGLQDDSGGIDGTHEGLCIAVAPSDFGTATTGVTQAATYVGKVTADDVKNTSDNSGAAAAFPTDPTTFDWGNFDNDFRSWGRDGSAFPNLDHQGKWTTGAGRIWDWSLSSGDTVSLDALTIPSSGDQTWTHHWSGTAAGQADCDALVPGSEFIGTDDCATTFLMNAMELMADGNGNDNGLCESDEACLVMPNLGAYQGHGTLVTSPFTSSMIGGLTGITLWKYDTNGYPALQ